MAISEFSRWTQRLSDTTPADGRTPHKWICERQLGKTREIVVLTQKQFEGEYKHTTCLGRLFGTYSIRKLSFKEIITQSGKALHEELSDPDIKSRVDNLSNKGPYSYMTKSLHDALQNLQAPDIESRIKAAIAKAEAEFGKLRVISGYLNEMRRISLQKREMACIPEKGAGLLNRITCYWNQFTLSIRKIAVDRQKLIDAYTRAPQEKVYLSAAILYVKIPLYKALVAFEDKIGIPPEQRKFSLPGGPYPDFQSRVPDMFATWKREYRDIHTGPEGLNLKRAIMRLDFVWTNLDSYLDPASSLKRRDVSEAKSG